MQKSALLRAVQQEILRHDFSCFVDEPPSVAQGVNHVEVNAEWKGLAALGTFCCWFCLIAVRTLGKQWTYEARVIQGHELITQGTPYAAVRNPIDLGMSVPRRGLHMLCDIPLCLR